MKIIGFSQLRNELSKGNLENWFNCMQRCCDYIFIFDQNSDDGSKEFYKTQPNTTILPSPVNNFSNELLCKQELLNEVLMDHPDADWIFWVDGDTLVEQKLLEPGAMKNLCKNAGDVGADGILFGHYNLWRSDIHYRIDSNYNDLNGNVMALWRNNGKLKFIDESGLHKRQYPLNISNVVRTNASLIHSGFSTDYQLITRYDVYKERGQNFHDLDRLLNEDNLTVEKLDSSMLPKFFKINDDKSPLEKVKIRQIYNQCNNKIVSSILITSYKRPELLDFGLKSLSKKKFKFNTEIIVLNDGVHDETENICKKYSNILNIKYVFTGHRNLVDDKINKWRTPGFAYNIGINMASGKFVFLSCAEMYHMNDTVDNMTSVLLANENVRVICEGKDDKNESFLNFLRNGKNPTIDDYNKCEYLKTSLPFFIGVDKQTLIDIGGYDEDFVGIAFDDDDIIGRLDECGIKECFVKNCNVVHLYHSRCTTAYNDKDSEFWSKWNYNRMLYESKRGIVVRNVKNGFGKS